MSTFGLIKNQALSFDNAINRRGVLLLYEHEYLSY